MKTDDPHAEERAMIARLHAAVARFSEIGVETSITDEFLSVGEWDLAFEGLYIMNRKHPQVLPVAEFEALRDVFAPDEDLSELDGV